MIFLDYLWTGLVFGTMTATVLMLSLLLIDILIANGIPQLHRKWLMNVQMVAILGFFLGGFAVLAVGNSELASRCFDIFIQQAQTYSVTRWLAGIWSLCVLFYASLDLWRIFRCSRQAQNYIRVTSLELKEALVRVAQRFSMTNVPRLVSSEEALPPYVYGWRHHQIVLPKSFLHQWPSEAMQSIFAHELVHVRDRDTLWLALSHFIQRLLFFHPLAGLIVTRHRLVVELAADEQAVLVANIPAQNLASSLVGVAAQATIQNPFPLRASVSRDFRDLKLRLESLGYAYSPSLSRLVLAGLAIALSLAFSLAQAKEFLVSQAERPGGMCTQVKFEKIFDSWLSITHPTPVNQCEKEEQR